MKTKIALMAIFLQCLQFSISTAAEYHKTDIGFHLSYLAKSMDYKKALDVIAADGFTHIAVYEPFAANLHADQDSIVQAINSIVGQKFYLQLSLSNFPYEEGTFSDLWEKNRKKISITEEKASKVYFYSNRFPPSDMKKYAAYLDSFMTKLEQAKLLERMTFEIGSEPDSNLYFWGSAADFNAIFTESYSVLRKHKASVLCCGLTSTLFTEPTKVKQSDFDQLVRTNDLIGKEVTFSFDMFFNTHRGYNDFSAVSYDKFKNGVISSFGIDTKVTEAAVAKQESINSEKFVTEFVKLLRFTYANQIKKVYLWRLMDNQGEKGRSGFFDMSGAPKKAYFFLKDINGVIANGYSVSSSDNAIEVVGEKKVIRLAIKEHAFTVPGKILSQSFSRDHNNRLQANDWLIFDKPSQQ